MKKLGILVVFTIIILAAPITAADLAGRPQRTVLPNGLTMITWLQSEARLTTISIWVKTGLINENSENSGISHFTEHLIFKGTADKNAFEIASQMESLGGDFNGFTAADFTCFYTTLPASRFLKGTDILLDMLAHPFFSRSDVENEKKVIIEEIIRQDENPDYYLKKIVHQNFFGNHPYGQPIIGSPGSLNHFSPEEITNYYHDYYQPANLVIVASGLFDTRALVELINKYFPQTKPARIKFPASNFFRPRQEKIIEIAKPVSLTYLTMGLNAPSVKSRDSYTLDLILKILSGGRSSRLVRELKEKKGLVSEITASYSTRKDPGIFLIDAIIRDPGKTTQTIAAIKEEIQKLATKLVSPEELKKAQDQAKTEYLLNLETSFEKTFILGYFEAIDSYLYGLNYLENLEKVTPVDIQKVTRKYLLSPGVIGIIKPESQEKFQLRNTA